MALVFVYGTLQKGFHNHRLLEVSSYCGPAKTADRYVLRSRPQGIPFVGRDKAVSQIEGELYEVSDATLRRLDQLEGCRIDNPELSWYHRELIDVHWRGECLQAWIYFNPDVREPIVEHGCWARA
jgi:gamma-glutamylaminecyclotransferase